jgi:hypothetical protein
MQKIKKPNNDIMYCFFSCNSRKDGFVKRFFTQATQIATDSRYEHVGVAYYNKEGTLMLFETINGSRTKNANRVIPLREKIAEMKKAGYKGDIHTITIPASKYNRDAFLVDVHYMTKVKYRYTNVLAFLSILKKILKTPVLTVLNIRVTFCSSTKVYNALYAGMVGVKEVCIEILKKNKVKNPTLEMDTLEGRLNAKNLALSTTPQEWISILVEAGYNFDKTPFEILR